MFNVRIGYVICVSLVSVVQVTAQSSPQLVIPETTDWSISDEQLVWIFEDDVYTKSLVTDETIRITDDGYLQTQPDVSDNIVVWLDYRHGNADVYGYDLLTNTEFAITQDAMHQWLPRVANGVIVYRNQAGLFHDIVIHELLSGTDTVISPGPILFATHFTDGEYVGWFDLLGQRTFMYAIEQGLLFDLDGSAKICGLNHDILARLQFDHVDFIDLQTLQTIESLAVGDAIACTLSEGTLVTWFISAQQFNVATGFTNNIIGVDATDVYKMVTSDNHVVWEIDQSVHIKDAVEGLLPGTARIGASSIGPVSDSLQLSTTNIPQSGTMLQFQVTGAPPDSDGFLFVSLAPSIFGTQFLDVISFLDSSQLLNIRFPLQADEAGIALAEVSLPTGSAFIEFYVQALWVNNEIGNTAGHLATHALKVNIMP